MTNVLRINEVDWFVGDGVMKGDLGSIKVTDQQVVEPRNGVTLLYRIDGEGNRYSSNAFEAWRTNNGRKAEDLVDTGTLSLFGQTMAKNGWHIEAYSSQNDGGLVILGKPHCQMKRPTSIKIDELEINSSTGMEESDRVLLARVYQRTTLFGDTHDDSDAWGLFDQLYGFGKTEEELISKYRSSEEIEQTKQNLLRYVRNHIIRLAVVFLDLSGRVKPLGDDDSSSEVNTMT